MRDVYRTSQCIERVQVMRTFHTGDRYRAKITFGGGGGGGIYREAEEDDGRGKVRFCSRRRGRVVR